MYKINSKAFRHEVYKLALECYKVRYVGICPCINYAIEYLFNNNKIPIKLFAKYNFDNNEYQYYDDFKEFYKFKPEHITQTHMFWFNTENRQIRIDILNKCIEQTE